MSLLLTGFGTSVPEHAIAQTDAAEIGARFAALDPKRAGTIRALYRKTGVRKRHSVLLERAEGAPMDRQSFYEEAVNRDDLGPSTELRRRRYAADAPALAEAAARAALRDAALEAKELTHVVTVSCTGFFSPGSTRCSSTGWGSRLASNARTSASWGASADAGAGGAPKTSHFWGAPSAFSHRRHLERGSRLWVSFLWSEEAS